MTRADAGRTWTAALLAAFVAAVVRAILPARVAPWLPAWGVLLALGLAGLVQAWRFRRERPDVGWRRDPGVYALVALLAVLMAALLSHGERVVSDGIDHYVYLRSVRVAGDLDLADDFAAVSP